MTEMVKRDYINGDMLEDYGPDYPGCTLRQALSSTPAPADPEHKLSNLLYTAQETYLLEGGISLEDALTVWRLVELARSSDPEAIDRMRM